MEKTLLWEGEPVLCYTVELPEIPEEGRHKPISAYYQKLGEAWCTRWEGELFQKAIVALTLARENSRPFDPWKAELIATVTYHQGALWSLLLDVTERTDTARPYLLRQGDTWDLKAGVPRKLESFFMDSPKWKQEILTEIKRQAGVRVRSGESLLDSDAPERVEKEFDISRFYLTEEGVVLFYPIDVLGPYGEGIPVFLVKKTCAEEDNGI